MKKCQYTDMIDDYLLNKLEGASKEQFEEHYFNCSSCFQTMEERDALVSTIRARGAWIFKKEPAAGRRDWVPAWKRALASFTPRQWATVGLAAAVVLFAVFGILPRFQGQTPQFVLSDNEIVRGESLTLISPVIDVGSVPGYFEWRQLGEDVEYKIFVYNSSLLWTEATRDTRIAVPDNVKQQMVAGQKYSWQVKAFSPKGTLIAVSSRVQFQVSQGK
ncbi:MAG: zf-HC2 domain-containing protein [Candidatus Aminicenantes bacterium]|nr:zf-HC2 domain-containing protein [Candidatus Aminicenantes bacterium]